MHKSLLLKSLTVKQENCAEVLLCGLDDTPTIDVMWIFVYKKYAGVRVTARMYSTNKIHAQFSVFMVVVIG